MASPQLEHGFARLANEITEALFRAHWLKARHFRVLLALIRHTYGNKGSPVEWVTSASRIEKGTSLNRRWAMRAVRELEAMEIVIVGAQKNRLVLRLQKDFERWKPEHHGTHVDNSKPEHHGTHNKPEHHGDHRPEHHGTHKPEHHSAQQKRLTLSNTRSGRALARAREGLDSRKTKSGNGKPDPSEFSAPKWSEYKPGIVVSVGHMLGIPTRGKSTGELYPKLAEAFRAAKADKQSEIRRILENGRK